MIREGDIVLIDEGLTYKTFNRKYKALVLWCSFINGQPLITQLDKWHPHWSTYSSVAEIVGHVDLDDFVQKMRGGEDDIKMQ